MTKQGFSMIPNQLIIDQRLEQGSKALIHIS
jgi:hypothetical protein